MDYEKKYKEALEMAKVAALNGHQNLMEGIFPELRESEDERIRKYLIYCVNRTTPESDDFNEISKEQILAWLEKQGTSYTKMNVDDAYVEGMAFAKDELEKQKSSWSEEDEKMNDLIISVLEVNHSKGIFKVGLRAIRTEEIVSWLITLKQRYTWKPSKEQMDAMQMAVSYFGYSWTSKEQKLLESLYDDLKKL